jgi:hypothetical protein
MEQAMAFAASPAGRQLMALMQQKGGAELTKAQALAASGDMAKAKDTLSALLADPQIRTLLKQFGE